MEKKETAQKNQPTPQKKTRKRLEMTPEAPTKKQKQLLLSIKKNKEPPEKVEQTPPTKKQRNMKQLQIPMFMCWTTFNPTSTKPLTMWSSGKEANHDDKCVFVHAYLSKDSATLAASMSQYVPAGAPVVIVGVPLGGLTTSGFGISLLWESSRILQVSVEGPEGKSSTSVLISWRRGAEPSTSTRPSEDKSVSVPAFITGTHESFSKDNLTIKGFGDAPHGYLELCTALHTVLDLDACRSEKWHVVSVANCNKNANNVACLVAESLGLQWGCMAENRNFGTDAHDLLPWVRAMQNGISVYQAEAEAEFTNRPTEGEPLSLAWQPIVIAALTVPISAGQRGVAITNTVFSASVVQLGFEEGWKSMYSGRPRGAQSIKFLSDKGIGLVRPGKGKGRENLVADRRLPAGSLGVCLNGPLIPNGAHIPARAMGSLKYVDNGDSFTVPNMPKTIRCHVAPGEGLIFLSSADDTNPANVEFIWEKSDLVLHAKRDINTGEVLRLPEGVLRCSGRSLTEHWLTVYQDEIWHLCEMHAALRRDSEKPLAPDACKTVFGSSETKVQEHALVKLLPNDYKEGMLGTKVMKALLDLEECMIKGRGYEHCMDNTRITVTRAPLDKVFGRGLYEVLLGVVEMEFKRQTGLDLRMMRKDAHDNNYPAHNLFALLIDQYPHFDSFIDFDDGPLWSVTLRFTEGTDTAFFSEDPGVDLNVVFRKISMIKDLDTQAEALAEALVGINALLKKMERGEGVAETRMLPQGFFVAFRATRVPHNGRAGINRVTMYVSARPANAPEHQKVAGLRTTEDPFFKRDFTLSKEGSKKIVGYLTDQLPEATLCTAKTLYTAMKVSPSTV